MANNRSRGRIFLEDVLGIRVRGVPDIRDSVPVAQPPEDFGTTLIELDGSSLFDYGQLNQFRTLTDDRNLQYKMYDEMAEDSIISAALELYADDATQYNTKGQVIWAESDDVDIAKFANRLIDILQLNENAWDHIYSLVKYGDLYLELFRDDELDDDGLITTDLTVGNIKVQSNREGAKLAEYLERVPNPATIYDLVKRGKTVGFIRVPESPSSAADQVMYGYTYFQQGQDIDILPPDKYVHIMLSNNTTRFPETLNVNVVPEDDEDLISEVDDIKVDTYKIKRGYSILYSVYKIYRELKLMEDSLLLNRVTRSSIIRIIQVEMGDMPADNERNVLKRLKQLIEQKNFLDKGAETFSNMANPGPIENMIYVPTRDGKGAVTAQTLGGDVNVKDIADMDYYANKLFGGLKIPKQFLGDTDDAAGFNGGTSLTKLDSRYARTIKRIQNNYISGITTLINLFALSHGLIDYVNNFTIRMTSPATTEDSEREEMQKNRISIVDDFMRLLDTDEYISTKTKKEIMVQFLNNYLNEPEIADLIEQDDTVDKAEEAEKGGPDFDRGGGGSSAFDDFGGGGGFDDLGGPSAFDEPMEEVDFDQDNFDFGEEPLGGGEDLGEPAFEVTPEEFGNYEEFA